MCTSILFPSSIASNDPLKVNWAHLRSSTLKEELNARELNTTRTCFCLSGGAGRGRQQLHHHHRAQADEARARDSGREETAPLTFVVHSKNGRGRVGAADIFSSVACNGTVLPSSLLAVTENKKRADPLMSHPYVTLQCVQGTILSAP